MKFMFKFICLSYLLSMLNSCTLFFPPGYLSQLVDQTSSSGGPGGGTTGKPWQTIGNAGFSTASAPSSILLKVNASGDPIVASYESSAYIYLNTFNSNWYENFVYMSGTMSGISFDLSNQTVPYLFAANNNGGMLYYSTNFNVMTTFNYIIAPPAFALSNDLPCVTYQSNNGNRYTQQWDGTTWSTPVVCSGSGGSTIMRYDPIGSTYYVANVPVNSLTLDVGSSFADLATPKTNFTIVNSNISMTAYGGYAYLLYQDISLGLAILRIDTNGILTPYGVITGASPVGAFSIAAGNSGQLYIAESDGASHDIKVYQYTNAVWTQVGSPVGQGLNPSIDIAPDGTPFVAFSDASFGNKITVKAFK